MASFIKNVHNIGARFVMTPVEAQKLDAALAVLQHVEEGAVTFEEAKHEVDWGLVADWRISIDVGRNRGYIS